MNAARAAHGLAPFHVDRALTRAAEAHSLDMLRRGYVSHAGLVSRLRAYGAHGPVVGENIAWGQGWSAQTIVSRWLASPEHRANLLRPGFRLVGLGSVTGSFEGASGVRMVTADFAGK